jgi:hypothetical protein
MARPPYVKLERKKKPRQVELEYLKRNPFDQPISLSFIDFHLDLNNPLPIEGNVTAMRRDGTGRRVPQGRHLLNVTETGGGKSVAMRVHVYADRHACYAGLLENWGADGASGVEIGYMEHLFARTCYGDADNNPEEFNAEAFAEFFEDGVRLIMRRLRGLRGDDVVHTPVPGDPAVDYYIDELRVFDSAFIDGQTRKRIWSAIEFIQLQGRKARVRIKYAATQDASLDDVPVRRGFTDREVGRLKEDIQADMAGGRGFYKRGGYADKIPTWQQGTIYYEGEDSSGPEELRYPMATNADMKALPRVPESVLWKPPPEPTIVHVPEPVDSWPEYPPEPPEQSAQKTRSDRLAAGAAKRRQKVGASVGGPPVDELAAKRREKEHSGKGTYR